MDRNPKYAALERAKAITEMKMRGHEREREELDAAVYQLSAHDVSNRKERRAFEAAQRKRK